MPVIDVHSHVTPPSFREAVLDGGTWHTLTNEIGELEIPEFSISATDRIAKMDAAGVDKHVLTVNNDFYRYELDPALTQEIARACNEEIGQMMADYPDRFTGLATVPMQDIERAVAEMEYAMSTLGYRGITINDHVNGATFDEPALLPVLGSRGIPWRGGVLPPVRPHFGQGAHHPLCAAQQHRQPRRPRRHVRHAGVRRYHGPLSRSRRSASHTRADTRRSGLRGWTRPGAPPIWAYPSSPMPSCPSRPAST